MFVVFLFFNEGNQAEGKRSKQRKQTENKDRLFKMEDAFLALKGNPLSKPSSWRVPNFEEHPFGFAGTNGQAISCVASNHPKVWTHDWKPKASAGHSQKPTLLSTWNPQLLLMSPLNGCVFLWRVLLFGRFKQEAKRKTTHLGGTLQKRHAQMQTLRMN